MRKKALFQFLILSLFLSLGYAANAAPATPPQASACVSAHATEAGLCARTASPTAMLLQIPDARTARSGGSDGGRGGAGNCWSACFHDYNDCMDVGPKDMCVSRMKTCLAICDTVSRRSGM